MTKSILQSENNPIELTTFFTLETYAIIRNIDQTLLKTNYFLEKYGYQFISIDFQELEDKFSDLFSIQNNSKSENRILIKEPDISISHEFYNVLLNSNLFEHFIFSKHAVIMLKRIVDFEQEVNNNIINMTETVKLHNEQKYFVSSLIQQFRLFKNGDIDCPVQFQINKNTRKVIYKLTSRNGNSYGEKVFSLNDNEVEILSNNFKDKFLINKLTELALNNFNLSYEIVDIKTRFITLMTCLESLFNLGKDQITHTVSRHLAIIISKSDIEFKQNYKRIKELYHLRSAIVHGGTPSEDLHKATDELQSKVRQAINYCLGLQIDKEKLFSKLNSFGFENPLTENISNK